jgi:RNA polymerase sigma factor (sigma-70 family)
MIGTKPASGVRHPRPFGAEGVEAMSDEQLLARFLGGDAETGEAAFRAIVLRHGPMVLGVCRHVLGGLHDAEDAFQATFLVLARKAGSIRDGRVLGRWLYEVGFRMAVRARANEKRRQTHERQGAEMSSPPADNEAQIRDVRPVLHEEVNRLPEKYRTPVVLCYLEGKTNEEVAQALGWPVGTVKGRLSRAREILRSRLSRRGVALSAALLLLSLSLDSAAADEAPAPLIDRTVETGMRVARGRPAAPGAVSPGALLLMKEHIAAATTVALLSVTAKVLLVAATLALAAFGVGQVSGGDGLLPDFPSPSPSAPAGPAAASCHGAQP